MIAIVLAGGRGTRLWPESRQLRPKQLCSFAGGKSMLQNTLERLTAAGFSRLMIVTGDDLKDAVERVADGLDDRAEVQILCEPAGKNTAPAAALALSECMDMPPDTLVGIFPADHHINDCTAFAHGLQRAQAAAGKGFLTLLGVTPTRPETGYGYIETTRYAFAELPEVYPVASFTEKPDLARAEAFTAGGQYRWNAGIYLARLDVLQAEYAAYLPEIYAVMMQGPTVFRNSFSQLPEVSLDQGIAEKSARLAVASGDFGWCDLGSWSALEALYPPDSRNNICAGPDSLLLESRDCLIRQQDKTVILYGVEQLLVVETADVILVADRRRTQDIRTLVDALRDMNRGDLL